MGFLLFPKSGKHCRRILSMGWGAQHGSWVPGASRVGAAGGPGVWSCPGRWGAPGTAAWMKAAWCHQQPLALGPWAWQRPARGPWVFLSCSESSSWAVQGLEEVGAVRAQRRASPACCSPCTLLALPASHPSPSSLALPPPTLSLGPILCRARRLPLSLSGSCYTELFVFPSGLCLPQGQRETSVHLFLFYFT